MCQFGSLVEAVAWPGDVFKKAISENSEENFCNGALSQ